MASISSNCLSSLSEAHDLRRTLIAFDFDHTIVEENTDIFLLRLLEGKDLPDEILSQKQSLGWTRYMGKIFQYLHSQGVKSQSIRTHMQKTPLVPGMLELFQHIRLNKKAYECIIISDSNSLFIWYIVHYGHLEDIFPSSCIYTNPARLDEKDCLRIDYHHHNTTCPISADNLCKGRVLKEHIDKNVGKYDGKKYRTVVFVGDGLNDYCPSLRLSPSDYVAARREHKLLAKITQNPSKVQARLVPWTDGSDLLAFIHNLEKCHA